MQDMIATTAVEGRTRNHWFDNVKFLLISSVVIVHFISPERGQLTSQSSFLRSIYVFFMLINMPLFSLISGCFSKADLGAVEMRKIIAHIVAPI